MRNKFEYLFDGEMVIIEYDQETLIGEIVSHNEFVDRARLGKVIREHHTKVRAAEEEEKQNYFRKN